MLQIILYGIPVAIGSITLKSFSIKLAIAIIIICIFGNLTIYLFSKITKNKIITIGIILGIIIVGSTGIGKLEFNIIETCTYSLISILNDKNIDKLYLLSGLSCGMFIFNFKINFKKLLNKENG